MHSLEQFAEQGNIIGTGSLDFRSFVYTYPVAEFIRTLKAPLPLNTEKNLEKYDFGKDLFLSNCKGCHATADGGGKAHVRSEKWELPNVYEVPMSVDHKPSPLNKVSQETFALLKEAYGEPPAAKKGVRVKRLKGVWAKSLLMSNGGVLGLDHALCLEGKKRAVPVTSEFTDLGHKDLCTKYSPEQRTALREFLVHWE
jgi:hypothetical protein